MRKQMVKKVTSVVLIALLIIATVVPVHAAQGVGVWVNNNRCWSKYIVCELNNKNQDGYVYITIDANYGDAIDVQMLNTNHRVIWSENRSLVKKYGSYRRCYRLGKNNKKYYIQVRCSKGNTLDHARVTVVQGTNLKAPYIG